MYAHDIVYFLIISNKHNNKLLSINLKLKAMTAKDKIKNAMLINNMSINEKINLHAHRSMEQYADKMFILARTRAGINIKKFKS